MFAQIVENLPKLPKAPDVFPNLSGLEAWGKQLVTDLTAVCHHVDTGLFISGLWVGAISMAVVWFVREQFRKMKTEEVAK